MNSTKRVQKFLAACMALALCLGLAVPAGAFGGNSDRLGEYSTISAGTASFAVIDTSGSLWTWGYNLYYGQLGNGTRTSSPVPNKIMNNVVSVSCGEHHAAAIKSDGSLWTWGSNVYGQLGNGKEGEEHNSSVPIKVMDNVSAVSCGGNFTAAIKTDGSLWMWGDNQSGQLGNNYQIIGGAWGSTRPVKIMDDVVAVSCGSSHAAAIKSDGSLWIWGLNIRGELGNGWTGNATNSHGWTYQTVPMKLMDNVAAVSCGWQNTAVIRTDGSLWMWGASYKGQIGLGLVGDNEFGGDPIQTVPVKVMDNVAAVSSGFDCTAAIKTDGSLWTWGGNDHGQLGNNGVVNDKDTHYWTGINTIPMKVMDNVAAVSGGGWGEFVAVKRDNTLWTWGYIGRDDNDVFTISSVPVNVMTGVALPTTAVVPSVPTVAGFSDVHENDYYADAVAWAKGTGVTGGTSATTFSPNAAVTRAEAMTFLWVAAGRPQPAITVSPFTDVTPGSYYYSAVLWAVENGITSGVGDGLFGRDEPLTYDQILTFLCVAGGGDVSGDWAQKARDWAGANGLTDGLSFNGGASCPRSDVIYCLWKQLA